MIAVPYHLGRRGVEVGRGPLVILDALKEPCEMIEGDGGIADINSRLARAVALHDRPVVVLAGNCNSCLGTLAGLDDPGIVWFDAHGDFNTPETTISGALEGMSLAIATGHCHPELMSRPVPEENVVLAATRSLDPLEEVRLHESDVLKLASLDALPSAVDELAGRVSTIYLHLDLDVLDPAISPGVNFSEPGGILPEELFGAVQYVMSTGKLGAVAIANFNPDRDRDGRTLGIIQELIKNLLAADERG
ncbi:MAG TPA: arginase family protein [Bryobacteraceae bacterium]|nr:arginase family protein [Bryobacteraceae bacterium]